MGVDSAPLRVLRAYVAAAVERGEAIVGIEAVECDHSWVAGMMVVNDEDLAAIAAAGRRVECERCDEVYRG